MLHLSYSRRVLRFNFPARTSRGALTEHYAYYLQLTDPVQPGRVGVGEAAPLAGLSPDYGPATETQIADFCRIFNQQNHPALSPETAAALVPAELPALRFALETAVLDWQQGGRRQLYDTPFSRGQAGIPINGLVWMGDAAFMREQIQKKLADGYSCLKLKIGGIDFATELRLLAEIRAVAPPAQLTLRVDANGAFAPAEALHKLQQLAQFELHSIEQPIRAGQWAAMAAVCRESPVPVALDEELIGITEAGQQEQLLDQIRPAYIILKPTLVGGLAATRRWIALAEARGIAWWLTSALESNVGLNAISQFAAQFAPPDFPQGLGTGQLYTNNIAAPLTIQRGHLYYEPGGVWGDLE
ncbi:o-succinylbenzoate synthase [Hymenobacter chitinivorans]|uniref:O-succinylbenzoate synthase n=1 Tax=Hymenobacter chitinivorans DSM 11115 TaxID=1121954 RepID=A0A2M9BT36_9BACT|nr:o-succinylbenzoate synthase [Hymenobacter chitinivorans]PJJ61119.1 o-succinylbenzoate synthase [Hymenobacter chitinivorans DSM 11115]